MAGDALMRDGEAIAREGEALMAEGDSGCCCPGGPGPGDCNPPISPPDPPASPCPPGCQACPSRAFLERWTNGQVRVVYNEFRRCCRAVPFRYTAVYRAIYRAFQGGCEVSTQIREWTGSDTNVSGTGTTRTIDRDPTLGCIVVSDITEPLRDVLGGCALTVGAAIGPITSGYLLMDCNHAASHLVSDGPTLVTWTDEARIIPRDTTCGPLPPGRGACCCDGDCYGLQTAAECRAMGGVYKGDDSSCLNVDCSVTGGRTRGACCLPSGDCDISSPAWCSQRGGVYQGDGTTCAQVTCPAPPEWPCCLPDQTCQPLTQSACAKAGGSWHPNTTCAEVNCIHEPQGACCLSNGSCVLTTSGACGTMGGVYRGDNTDCATSPCTGACCSSGACSISTPQACAGFFLGFGTTCDPNPCGGGGTIQPILDVGDFVRTGSGAFR